jgi:glutamate dehydrogenase
MLLMAARHATTATTYETTIAAIRKLLHAKVSPSGKVNAAFQAFADVALDKYFADIDEADLPTRDAAAWASIVANHLAFGHEFQRGAPKMRIFTPKLVEHGWEAPCTVIEFINDDMPFLVDSIAMEINRQGIAMQQIAHPLYAATRDAHGALTALASSAESKTLESWIHIEIERITDAKRIKALGDGLVAVLSDVRAAVEDWPKMKAKVAEVLSDLGGAAKVVPLDELDEARAFLSWMGDNHFTFLGYRDYSLASENGKDVLKFAANSGLGVLREPKLGGVSASFNDLPETLRKLAREPRLLVLTKANARATVHRAGYLDYVGIKRFDDKGNVVGERRFIGLYTSSSYHGDPTEIPLIRQKIAKVMARAGFPAQSHAMSFFRLVMTSCLTSSPAFCIWASVPKRGCLFGAICMRAFIPA